MAIMPDIRFLLAASADVANITRYSLYADASPQDKWPSAQHRIDNRWAKFTRDKFILVHPDAWSMKEPS
ncbi:hypothetical protein D9756_010135 [Leucocoprinus leucothites]|uniref:Uncharacterized protein n=1 Tax=Leucocoprinus leucothites TaxID=201217 RepID=A0A8H5CUN6_9AGAR|nr:hypothetical protein D9756_010135 [Leucoagaricus leucothites]